MEKKMITKLLSTGQIISAYLEANDLNIFDLAKASGVEAKTIYRLINDESKVSYKVVQGMNKLIPGISLDFLVSYDAKYQLQKHQFMEKKQIDDYIKVIDFFKLRKLYRHYYHDNIKLIEIAHQVFGSENLKQLKIDDNVIFAHAYSRAKNPDNNASSLWLVAAYRECLILNDGKELLVFDFDAFKNEFKNIKQVCGTTDIKSTLFNIKMFCESCGINFLYRPSIPNSRVKAAAVKDKNGKVFIFMSDLFRCVENLWLSFVHECVHILKRDFCHNSLSFYKEKTNYENFVDIEAMRYFFEDLSILETQSSFMVISQYAKQKGIPIGITAEIYRYINQIYNDNDVNMYIHYYKSEDLEWESPF